nr:MAG TPA: helix-turn-helix domain protein [Caudoviricetes sp.]
MSKDEINKLIGVRLKSARKDRGLTLLELSQKVGLSEGNVQRYEAGNIANVSIAVLLKFASALYVPPEQLLGWKSGTDGEVLAPDEESLL